MKNKIKIIIAFIVGAIVFGGVGVYATIAYSAKEIVYKDKTVEEALDELYGNKNNLRKCEGTSCKCKRATSLHTETCKQTNTSQYCSGAGYTETGSKKTKTITYGQLGHSGTLRPGDAFDCDVDGHGNYKRFYYMSLSNGVAVLVYYNNVSQGEDNNQTLYPFCTESEIYKGPDDAKLQLPTTTQWPNIVLSNNIRKITTELGGTTNKGGNLPSAYSYEGYAARLLTAQEVNAACNITIGTQTNGEIDSCLFLLENTKFSSDENGAYGYWLETPYSIYMASAHYISGQFRSVRSYIISDVSGRGVRPVIEVSISDIEY